MLIDTANTGKKITSELQPRGAGSTVRFNLVHNAGRLPGGDFLGEATRDQIAEHSVGMTTLSAQVNHVSTTVSRRPNVGRPGTA